MYCFIDNLSLVKCAMTQPRKVAKVNIFFLMTSFIYVTRSVVAIYSTPIFCLTGAPGIKTTEMTKTLNAIPGCNKKVMI